MYAEPNISMLKLQSQLEQDWLALPDFEKQQYLQDISKLLHSLMR